MNAGVRTQWDNMVPHVMARPDIRPHVVEITPYKAGALWEHLARSGFLPCSRRRREKQSGQSSASRQELLDRHWGLL